MSGFLIFISTVAASTVACVEVPLFIYRKIQGQNRMYPLVSAMVRTAGYTPCLIGTGHGAAIPMFLGPALWWRVTSDSEMPVFWLSGIPAILMGLICFGLSTFARARMLAKKELNQACQQ